MKGLGLGRPWTVEVVGTYAVSDPDTLDSDSALGRKVTLLVAQVRTNGQRPATDRAGRSR